MFAPIARVLNVAETPWREKPHLAGFSIGQTWIGTLACRFTKLYNLKTSHLTSPKSLLFMVITANTPCKLVDKNEILCWVSRAMVGVRHVDSLLVSHIRELTHSGSTWGINLLWLVVWIMLITLRGRLTGFTGIPGWSRTDRSSQRSSTRNDKQEMQRCCLVGNLLITLPQQSTQTQRGNRSSSWGKSPFGGIGVNQPAMVCVYLSVKGRRQDLGPSVCALSCTGAFPVYSISFNLWATGFWWMGVAPWTYKNEALRWSNRASEVGVTSGLCWGQGNYLISHSGLLVPHPGLCSVFPKLAFRLPTWESQRAVQIPGLPPAWGL